MTRARALADLANTGIFSPNAGLSRVGINSTSPSVTLDVGGGASFTGNVSVGGTLTYDDVTNIDSVGIITARSGIDVGTGTSISTPSSNTLTLGTNNEERLRIDSSGNIGINQATPASDLDLTSSVEDGTGSLADHGIRLAHVGATNEEVIPISACFVSTQNRSRAGIGFISKQADSTDGYAGEIGFYTRSAADGSGLLRSDERLRIDSSGRVLLGTGGLSTDQDAAFQVASTSFGVAQIFRTGSAGSALHLSSTTGTLASPAALADGDHAGYLSYRAYDGAAWRTGANIGAAADGQTWASGDCPTRLVFATTADGGTSPTERLRIDSAGDMGLGVAPNNVGSMRTLHIKGPSSEGAAIRLQADGDTADSDDFQIYKNASAAYLRVNGSDPLRFYLNGGDRAVITSGGNMGVGSAFGGTDPDCIFHVRKDSPDTTFTNETTPSSESGVKIANLNGTVGTWTALTLSVSNGSATQNGSIVAKSVSSGTRPEIHITQRNGSATESKITINSSGNVGINESSPTRSLSVGGSMNLATGSRIESDSSGGDLLIQGGSTYPGGHIKMYGGTSDDKIEFCTSGGSVSSTVRYTVESNGSLRLTPEGSTANPNARIDTSGDNLRLVTMKDGSGGCGLIIETQSGGAVTERVRVHDDGVVELDGSASLVINESSPTGNFFQEITYSPSTKGCVYLENFAYYSSQPALVVNDKDTNNARVMEDVQFQRNGTLVGYIRINPGSVTYSESSSDIRSKKNFEDWTEDNLSKFKTLSPKLFNWIEEDDGSEKTKGFIAQDNLEKFPKAYPLTTSTDRYMFNPSGMVAYMMKALQEAALKIETLEAKVAALEG